MTQYSKVINGVNISYKDIGQGRILFCLPPYPTSSTVFIPFINHALKKNSNIRFIAFDLPGFGGFSSLPKDNFTMEEYTKLIEDFILSFKAKNYSILGYSYGGFLLSYMLSRKIINPEKAVMVSGFYNGRGLIEYQPLLNYMRFFKLIKPGSFLNYLCAIFTENDIKISDLKIFLQIRKKDYVKKLFKEIRNMSFSTSYQLLHWTKDIILNQNIFKNTDSLVVYSDRDLAFIKKQSMELERNGIKAVRVINEGHRHFFFNVEKSATYIVKFLQSFPPEGWKLETTTQAIDP